MHCVSNWRVERDSNPRNAFTFAGFQDRSNQPLCHLPVASAFSRRVADCPERRLGACCVPITGSPSPLVGEGARRADEGCCVIPSPRSMGWRNTPHPGLPLNASGRPSPSRGEGKSYGSSTTEPVVSRPSSARCASAASLSGKVRPISTLMAPSRTASNSLPAPSSRSSRLPR